MNSEPEPCADTSARQGEALTGTAPIADLWVAIEASELWDRRIAGPPAWGQRLNRLIAQRSAPAKVRVVFIRRPGDRSRAARARRVLISHPGADEPWLEEGLLHDGDPFRVLDLEFAAIAAGHRPGTGRRSTDPVLLVCSDPGRDRCCADRGGSLAADLASGTDDAVWECSHLGGHRFAATGLLLPTGYVYGNLTAELAATVRQRAREGLVEPAGLRGRCILSLPAQAAEMHVRQLTGARGLSDVRLGPQSRSARNPVITVEHRDGRRWLVSVSLTPGRNRYPNSCGPPLAMTHLRIAACELVTGPAARPARLTQEAAG